MILSHAVVLAISALPLLAAATPLDTRGGGSGSSSGSCSTGTLQCCDSTLNANSPAGEKLLGLLGIVLQDVNVVLGLSCSSINVVGVGSSSGCSAQTVCCEDTSNSLVSIGCLPVSL
ncbi:fungal hydrophobin [Trametes coccinea BRFM310]|uniref:Hydrophobin n=1 Tax=Trametes coccinea (strain BRFM310) TaxID=1353009 RepID=A0A1Y2INB1_TRAC3|nr:fungal hydrophobin [Trametes coccinea BRFM310]